MQPSISIVVTCYNYGHFLDACLDSLAAQTQQPDEIIVVDDGSTDATRSVLRARNEPLTVLEKENGGQASAFNAGFARATSDIVLFLDADDTLAPDAVEAICMAWHDSLAAIGFRLNLIDATGRFSGFYEVEPREGDMRPELTDCGHFRFLPTSGNAFNRRLIAPAFPLPEPRWRISADTVLLRAAALAGPIRQLPFALGNYRAHGGNSYHRVVMPPPQFRGRAMRDAADASLAIADLPGDSALFGPDPDIVRLDLVLTSLRLKLGLHDFGEREPRPLRVVSESIRRLARLRIGVRAKALYCFGLALLPLSFRLVPRSRTWAVEPDRRPRILSRSLSWVLGSDLERRRRLSRRSRWLESARVGYPTPWGGQHCVACFNSFDWRLRRSESGRVLCSGVGEIVVATDYFPHGAKLNLDLKATAHYAEMPLEVALSFAGQLLGHARIRGDGRLSVVLEPTLTLLDSPLHLKISVSPRPMSLPDLWTLLTAPAGVTEAIGLQLEAISPARTGFTLSMGEHRDFAGIAGACQASPPVDPDLPDRVESGELVLCLTRPALPETTELVVRFQEDQVDGSLVVTDGSDEAYRGSVRGLSVVRIPVRPRRFPDDRELVLTLSLDTEDPFEAPALRLLSIGLAAAEASFEVHSPKKFPLMGSGAIWRFEEAAEVTPNPLGDGWTRSEAGAELFDTLGVLRFTVDPATADDAVLYMRVAPAASLPEEAPPAVSAALSNDAPALPDDTVSDMRLAPTTPRPEYAPLAVAVTIRDAVVAQVLLEGEHKLAVPLKSVLAKGGRQVELAVHAARPVGSGPDVGLDRAGLLLKSMQLSSKAWQPPVPGPTPDRAGRTLNADIETAGARARRLRAKDWKTDPSVLDELVSMHGHIAAAIRGLAGSAVLSVLLSEETLGCLCDLGDAIAEAGTDLDAPRSDGDYAGLFSTNPVEAVRSTALAILTVPPWRALSGRAPDKLPDVLRAFPLQLARYLCSTSHEAASADDRAAYGRHVLSLLAYARACFALEPRGSRHERLAEEVLRHVRLHPLLFGPGSLRDGGRALGAATETYLLTRGRRITMACEQTRAAGPLRLGVLLRDLRAAPEAQIFAGTIGALPPDVFDVTVFTLERGTETLVTLPGFVTIVDLEGVGTDRAVEIARASKLDIFLLGAFFQHYVEVAAIVAHRLAPVQVATTAVSPMTTGLRSFDAMLSSSSCEPPDAATHYTERLHLAEAPVQRFDFGTRAPRTAVKRAAERKQLGVPADAVVLASGAMLMKIGRGLLDAWVDILAAAPQTVLLLYPFPANWRTSFQAAGRFERRVREACAAKGVDPERIRILASIDHSEVERILRISDIYLDSFPYAGATTVVEALKAGLPGVALAGDSQRGLQGAAWLRTCGLEHLVAETPAEYVRIASDLANDAGARAAAAASIRWPASLEAEAFGRQFAAILTELAGRAAASHPPAGS